MQQGVIVSNGRHQLLPQLTRCQGPPQDKVRISRRHGRRVAYADHFRVGVSGLARRKQELGVGIGRQGRVNGCDSRDGDLIALACLMQPSSGRTHRRDGAARQELAGRGEAHVVERRGVNFVVERLVAVQGVDGILPVNRHQQDLVLRVVVDKGAHLDRLQVGRSAAVNTDIKASLKHGRRDEPADIVVAVPLDVVRTRVSHRCCWCSCVRT